MNRLREKIFGPKVGGVRVTPLVVKIVAIFAIFLLLSNLATNAINLWWNRAAFLRLAKELLVKDLKAVYAFSDTQHQIFEFNEDLADSQKALESRSMRELDKKHAVFLGVYTNGAYFYQATKAAKNRAFDDPGALAEMNATLARGGGEGFFRFQREGDMYLGVYKYHATWQIFFVRAEKETEFYAESVTILRNISLVILLITLLAGAVGIYLINDITRFVGQITRAIMRMSQTQKLDRIDMKGASNDEITYLGMSLNSLSSTIDNLIDIFRRFVSRDVAVRAYEERQIRLEGQPMELTILFTDIKGFTTMTEALGTDIIRLLNLHYEKAIWHIFENDGIIGSIIGDALLAVYGAMPGSRGNKSRQSVESAYKIIEVARSIRMLMHERKEELEKKGGALSPEQEKVFKAVLIEVGVGIDGGEVFYGNIGSSERMTNTVIGDNVNSAARLEGLTRVYKVPVICSEFVKNEILSLGDTDIRFVDLDLVQVKGKTEGKKVYWPVFESQLDDNLRAQIDVWNQALPLYLEGKWAKAKPLFEQCGSLPMAAEFVTRTGAKAPKTWNGIWEMKSK